MLRPLRHNSARLKPTLTGAENELAAMTVSLLVRALRLGSVRQGNCGRLADSLCTSLVCLSVRIAAEIALSLGWDISGRLERAYLNQEPARWSRQPAKAVFQRKLSSHEANNLIPFEAPPSKAYSGIYFIAGLRHCWTASLRDFSIPDCFITGLHRIRLAPHFTSGLSMLLVTFLFPHSVKLFFPLELHSR